MMTQLFKCPHCKTGKIPVGFQESGEKDCYFIQVSKCLDCGFNPTPEELQSIIENTIDQAKAFNKFAANMPMFQQTKKPDLSGGKEMRIEKEDQQ